MLASLESIERHLTSLGVPQKYIDYHLERVAQARKHRRKSKRVMLAKEWSRPDIHWGRFSKAATR